MCHVTNNKSQANNKQDVKQGMSLLLFSVLDANFAEHKMFKDLAT